MFPCVRVAGNVVSCFTVTIGLNGRCGMSPWLLNIYMDEVVREVYERTQGRGVNMVDRDHRE